MLVLALCLVISVALLLISASQLFVAAYTFSLPFPKDGHEQTYSELASDMFYVRPTMAADLKAAIFHYKFCSLSFESPLRYLPYFRPRILTHKTDVAAVINLL